MSQEAFTGVWRADDDDRDWSAWRVGTFEDGLQFHEASVV